MRARTNLQVSPHVGFERRMRDLLHSLVSKVLTFQSRYVWERKLEGDCEPAGWPAGETVEVIGPESAERAGRAPLFEFLGGERLAQELEGVRKGDRLFVVCTESGYAAYSFIFFDTTKGTRRQKKILLERPGTPVIGLSFTAPQARGRGIYRRLLKEMFRFLSASGVERVVCEVDPRNGPSNAASRAAGMQICRELTDCIIARRLVIQRVREAGAARWRILLV